MTAMTVEQMSGVLVGRLLLVLFQVEGFLQGFEASAALKLSRKVLAFRCAPFRA